MSLFKRRPEVLPAGSIRITPLNKPRTPGINAVDYGEIDDDLQYRRALSEKIPPGMTLIESRYWTFDRELVHPAVPQRVVEIIGNMAFGSKFDGIEVGVGTWDGTRNKRDVQFMPLWMPDPHPNSALFSFEQQESLLDAIMNGVNQELLRKGQPVTMPLH